MLGQRGEPEAPWGHATAQALKQPTSPSHQGQIVGHEVEVGARALRNQAGGEGGGGWIQACAAEWGARASVVASSRGNIPSCELMGHMPMDLKWAILSFLLPRS